MGAANEVIQIGDKIQIDPNVPEPLTIEGNKRLGQTGVVLKIITRRPPYRGRSNDEVVIRWPDRTKYVFSTYWLTTQGNLEMDIAILKWKYYFDNGEAK